MLLDVLVVIVIKITAMGWHFHHADILMDFLNV